MDIDFLGLLFYYFFNKLISVTILIRIQFLFSDMYPMYGLFWLKNLKMQGHITEKNNNQRNYEL